MKISHALMSAALVAACAIAGVANAKGERTAPEAQARAESMRAIAGATKTLGDMAGGKAAFDAVAAEAARKSLSEAAGGMSETYKVQGAADAASEAKAEIWTNWDDFIARADALKTAADAMDLASAETIKAGMGAIGGTCKDCHSTYRQ